MDFGVQLNSNSTLDFSGQVMDDAQIQSMVTNYAAGYMSCGGQGKSLMLAIGTNNAGGGGSGYGSAWAYEVQGVGGAIDNSGWGGTITVWGGMDFEPQWNTQANGESWAQGFGSVNSNLLYVNYGAATGCPPAGTCSNGWTQQGIQYVSYGAPPALAVPEIYYQINAQQWADISDVGYIGFTGTLDEYPRDNQTNTSTEAVQELDAATGQSVGYATELQSGYMG